LQLRCIAQIRQRMNMIHHVQKGKDPSRLCVPDVGKLATNGQWHCHGMASVEAALLLPFSPMLGIDIRFVDGFVVCSGRDEGDSWDGRPRKLCDHTWLEVTLMPSCIKCVVDASSDEHEGCVALAVEKAYSLQGRRYPVRTLTSAVPIPKGKAADDISSERSIVPRVDPRSVVVIPWEEAAWRA